MSTRSYAEHLPGDQLTLDGATVLPAGKTVDDSRKWRRCRLQSGALGVEGEETVGSQLRGLCPDITPAPLSLRGPVSKVDGCIALIALKHTSGDHRPVLKFQADDLHVVTSL